MKMCLYFCGQDFKKIRMSWGTAPSTPLNPPLSGATLPLHLWTSNVNVCIIMHRCAVGTNVMNVLPHRGSKCPEPFHLYTVRVSLKNLRRNKYRSVRLKVDQLDRRLFAVCFFAGVTLRHLSNMSACLGILASFLFASYYRGTFFSVVISHCIASLLYGPSWFTVS